ncbi:MAG: ATP-binding protein [Pseudomonadota bacterium]
MSDLLASHGLRNLFASRSPESVDLLGLALNEILYTVVEVAGEQRERDESCIELWADTHLVVFCVKFQGAPLPDWLLANWDRAQEPAVLAPPDDSGWGWLLVREALDSVMLVQNGDTQHLFLERRVQT